MTENTKYVCRGRQRHWFAGRATCKRCGAPKPKESKRVTNSAIEYARRELGQ